MKATDRSTATLPAEEHETPLLTWLAAHYPRLLQALLNAEGAIFSLEQQGVVSGEVHERACRKLRHRFEEARWLKLHAETKVWLQ
jgi:hypothetical protein